jgi:hypothetical protein
VTDSPCTSFVRWLRVVFRSLAAASVTQSYHHCFERVVHARPTFVATLLNGEEIAERTLGEFVDMREVI